MLPENGAVQRSGSPERPDSGISPESSDEFPAVPGTRAGTDPLSDNQRAYLTILFNKYRGPLYRYLTGLVSSHDDVGELVQESYLRLMRHTEAVRFEAVARSYLFQTATNLARDYFRRRASHRAERQVSIDEAMSLPSEEMSTERMAAWEQAVGTLRSAIQEMPTDLRDSFLLSRFEDQSPPEIAASLGVSRRTVERRLRQAMALLTERMRGVL